MAHVDTSNAATGHHPYACIRRRSRKVKCDKVTPGCANCADAGLPCVYTARRPRNSQKLRHASDGFQPYKSPTVTPRSLLPATTVAAAASDKVDPQGADEDDIVMPHEMQDRNFVARLAVEASDRGSLLMANGKSRYIDGNKTHEVAELGSMLAAETNGAVDATGARLGHPTNEWDSSILLGMSSPKENLRAHYPDSRTSAALWDHYTRHADILVKVIYKPSVDKLISRACKNNIDVSAESLCFAIRFGSVYTMSPEECIALCRVERNLMLRKFYYGLQKALAKAGWMTTQDIMVLQALTLLIVFAPGRSTRLCWMLTGMAMNIAQAMGLHRDGTCFSLSATETEVRRRTWWTLCQLDNRISLDCGLEQHIPLTTDTNLSLHINDCDLELSSSAKTLVPRTSFTEMSVSLIKIEMAKTSLTIKRRQCATPPLTDGKVEDLLNQQIARYENLYIPCLDTSDPLQRLCQLGTRLIITKLYRTLYNIRKDSEAQRHALDEAEDDQSIAYAADILEIAYQLPDRDHRFGWFFGCKYTQWHTMAWLLMALCKRPRSPSANRAWAVLDIVTMDMSKKLNANKAPDAARRNFSKPLLTLLDRARGIKDASVTMPSPSKSNTLSVVDSGYESGSLMSSNTEDFWTCQDGLLGDPFIGFGMDFGLEMNWEDMSNLPQF